MTQAILYGIPISLYTGRARSYLIKAGIDYKEVSPIERRVTALRLCLPLVEEPVCRRLKPNQAR